MDCIHVGFDNDGDCRECGMSVTEVAQQRAATLQQLERLKQIVRDCRPHVSMSRSITSGWEFKENVDRLLARIDAELV